MIQAANISTARSHKKDIFLSEAPAIRGRGR